LGIFYDRLLETNNSTGTVQLFIPSLDNYYWQLVSTEIHLAQAAGKESQSLCEWHGYSQAENNQIWNQTKTEPLHASVTTIPS